MANDLNSCSFIGRLGNDPESKYTASGTQVTNISIAVGWKSKDKEGTEWVRVTAFGKLAEIMSQYLNKGSQVYIQGRMKTDKWQDKDGKDRYSTGIVADNLQMLGGRESGSGSSQSQPQPQSAPKDYPDKAQSQDDGFDSMPF